MTDKFQKSLRVLIILFVLSLLTASIAGVAISQLPFDTIRPIVDSLAVDGDADFFTSTLASSLQQKLLFTSLLLILVSLSLFFLRDAINKTARQIIEDAFALSPKEFSLNPQNSANASNSIQTFDYLMLFTCFAIAGWLRYTFLHREIYYDEAFSFLSYGSKPLILGLSNYTEPNNHLLHTAFLRISFLIFGSSEWALRVPAFISGMLLLPAMFFFANLVRNKRVAFISTALLCCSIPLIEYGTLARGYSQLVLFFILLCATSVLLLTQPKNFFLRTVFILISAAGFYTIPTFLYGWIALILWLALGWLRHDEMSLKDTICSIVILGACSALLTISLYLPPFIAVGPAALFSNTHVASKGLAFLLQEGPASLLWTWENWHLAMPSILPWFFALCALVGLLAEMFSPNKRVPLVLVLVFSALALVALQQVVPYRRIWLYLLPIYLFYVAIGVDTILSRILKLTTRLPFPLIQVALCLLLLLQAGSINNEYAGTFHSDQGTLRSAKEITQWIKPLLKKGDRILTIAPADSPMRYYFLRSGLPLDFLDPEAPVKSENSPNRIFLVHNLEPNFTKGGSALYETIEENLKLNGHSSLLGQKGKTRKQFPFASVYLYAVE